MYESKADKYLNLLPFSLSPGRIMADTLPCYGVFVTVSFFTDEPGYMLRYISSCFGLEYNIQFALYISIRIKGFCFKL